MKTNATGGNKQLLVVRITRWMQKKRSEETPEKEGARHLGMANSPVRTDHHVQSLAPSFVLFLFFFRSSFLLHPKTSISGFS